MKRSVRKQTSHLICSFERLLTNLSLFAAPVRILTSYLWLSAPSLYHLNYQTRPLRQTLKSPHSPPLKIAFQCYQMLSCKVMLILFAETMKTSPFIHFESVGLGAIKLQEKHKNFAVNRNSKYLSEDSSPSFKV